MNSRQIVKEERQMIFIITDNRVNNLEAYLPLAKAFVLDTLNDTGCHGVEICTDETNPNRVVFLSRWESKQDFAAHCNGTTFTKHIPGMVPYYISGTDTFLDILE